MGEDHSADLPGIALLDKEQSAEDELFTNEQVNKFSPTPFTWMRPLLVTEASYTSRKQLFAGEIGSLDPREEDPPNEDKAQLTSVEKRTCRQT